MGLEINIEKTKALEMDTARRLCQNWTIGEANIEVDADFTYFLPREQIESNQLYNSRNRT